MNIKELTYTSKSVYIGIDVHKKSYTFSAYCDRRLCKTATVPSKPENFAKSLQKWFPGGKLFSVYEAGFSGFGLHRTLESFDITNIVINPASLEVAAKDKVKTDKKDSRKMAKHLSDGNLIGIHIPSQSRELSRLITRTREQLVKERSRVGVKIKSRMFYFGYIGPQDDRVMSHKLLKEYESTCLPEELQYSLSLLIENWRLLDKQIKDIRYRMLEQSFDDSYNEAVYRSVPGVGDVSARTLSNELGDLSKRFKNQKSLYQFVGLTPTEYSSGDKQRLGHIDRQGSARIRKTLIECAWRAVSLDDALKESFNRIAHRRGKKRAIVAIARKLLGRMRACFVSQSEYELGVVA